MATRARSRPRPRPGVRRPAGKRPYPKRQVKSVGLITSLVILGCTLAAALALPLCVLLVLGMIPTAVAAVVDHHRAKYFTRTVGAMNLAGLAPLIIRLWTLGDNVSTAFEIISRPINWLMVYGAAGVGWVIFLAMPAVANVIVEMRTERMQEQLKERAKSLVEEWGDEVKGSPGPNAGEAQAG